MSPTTTIRTTRYATQDRVVHVLMGICMAAVIFGAVDLIRSL